MFYLGIDVAKSKLDCYLLLDEASGKGKAKVVPNSADGLTNLRAWLTKNHAHYDQVHAVMEATGVYHEFVAYQLHDSGIAVSIANPARVKYFGKGLAIHSKTDGIDSLVLARYGVMNKPERWTPPTVQARVLQGLLARREAIEQDLLREQNRQEKALSTCTSPVIHHSLAVSIAFLNTQKAQLQQQIDDQIADNATLKNDFDLLQSIPAIGPQSGANMLAVMHTHHFNSAEQLAAYLGLVPIERQSGTSLVGRPRLSKNGPARLRAVLYMAAMVGIKHNPHLKALYERLRLKGKSKMSALGAAMRKLVHLCFGVLKTQKMYQAEYQGA